MSLRSTRIWQTLRKKKNELIKKYNYFKNKKMPTSCYEDYLVNRTYEMMQRKPEVRPFAYRINFDNPVTFTEKRQWLKLYGLNSLETTYTDKYEVRKHISDELGDDFLVPLISINGKECFESTKEIDFSKLPNSFVLKCTHGSHMNIIVKDKSSLTKYGVYKIKKQLNRWLKINYAFWVSLELQYKDIKPRIIIEKFLDFGDKNIPDYKFFCFNGKPLFVGVFENRYTTNYTEAYLDMNFIPTKFRLDYYNDNPNINKPSTFETMKKIANILCAGFPFVRVDLYEWKGKVYFGELTFSSAAGYDFPNPFQEYDKKLGDLIQIDKSIRSNNYQYRKRV